MSAPLNVVVLNGSPSFPSKTAALAQAIVAELGSRIPVEATSVNVAELVPFFGDTYGDPRSPVAAALDAISGADLLIAASPIYKGSYTGLFKHVVDLLSPSALLGTPVLLVATGGTERHTLALEHQFRPLFGFFQADTLPVTIYGHDSEFTDYQVSGESLAGRIDKALTRALPFLSTEARDASLLPVL